jgi:hypothetical protein
LERVVEALNGDAKEYLQLWIALRDAIDASETPTEPGQARLDVPADRPTVGDLPRRVPAEPDVPAVPDPPEPGLSRIANYLREISDGPAEADFDIPVYGGVDIMAVLELMRQVNGVRDASLRAGTSGVYTLRLELADSADPADVARVAAQLLANRLGLVVKPTS